MTHTPLTTYTLKRLRQANPWACTEHHPRRELCFFTFAVDGRVGYNSDRLLEEVRQIGAGGGGIYVRTGLEAAAAALAESTNQVKHIILLADGADSEQKEGVEQLVGSLVAEGATWHTTVTISSVASPPPR